TRALWEQYEKIWTDIFLVVLPRVTAAIRRKLALTAPPCSEMAVQSVIQSVARTVLRRARAGKFADYHLETADDLAAVFVQIAWRKCTRKIRDQINFPLRRLPFDDDDSATAGCELPGPEGDPLNDLVRQEMRDQVRQLLTRFCESLECIDRVILQNKL